MIAGRDLDWSELMADAKPVDCVPVAATDPLYISYTSGTTGLPKGVVRDNGGHLVALKWSMKNIYGVSRVRSSGQPLIWVGQSAIRTSSMDLFSMGTRPCFTRASRSALPIPAHSGA